MGLAGRSPPSLKKAIELKLLVPLSFLVHLLASLLVAFMHSSSQLGPALSTVTDVSCHEQLWLLPD